MNTITKVALRTSAAVSVLYAAIFADALLPGASALPSSPGCGLGGDVGALCSIDGNGCEIWLGEGVTNGCNSAARADGTWFHVVHQILAPRNPGDAVSNFIGQGPSGTSAYATLWCSENGQAALYRGTIQPNQTKFCSAYALKSVCGSSTVCAQY